MTASPRSRTLHALALALVATTAAACSSSSGGGSGATPAAAPVIASFAATPPSIMAGASSTLGWSVTGATSLSVVPGVGSVSGTGTTVSPLATTTYTLTATGPGGNSTAAVTVTVNAAPVVPVSSVTVALPVDDLQAGRTAQASAVVRDAGGTVLSGRTVTWASTNGAAAAVDGSGLVSALAVGGTTISASCEGVTGTSALTVSDQAQAVLTTAGGTLASGAGLVVDVPQGAIDLSSQVGLASNLAATPSDAVTPLYEFQPAGTIFARPLTVTIPLPPGATTGSVYWSRLDGSGFDVLGGTIADGSITVETPHFSSMYVGPVATSRTLSGVAMTTFISASSRESLPTDLSARVPRALVLSDAGAVTWSASATLGSGKAAGTFSIPDVPVGEYVLQVPMPSGGGFPKGLFVVSQSSSPDLGLLYPGLPASVVPPDLGTVLSLAMRNLAPWQAGDYLEFVSSESNVWEFNLERFAATPPAAGDTATTVDFDLSMASATRALDGSMIRPTLVQGSLGHRAYVAHVGGSTSADGVPYLSIKRAAALPTFDAVQGATLRFDLSLADVAQARSTHMDVPFSQWKAAIVQDGNPSQSLRAGDPTSCRIQPNPNGLAMILAQAGQKKDGMYMSNADLLWVPDVEGADLLTGTMTYPDPEAVGLEGTWAEIANVRWYAWICPTLPSTVGLYNISGFRSGVQWTTSREVLESGPAHLPLSQPRDFAVNGASAFVDGSGVGLNPRISWSAPRIGTPAYYALTIVRIFRANLDGQWWTVTSSVAKIVTPHTSIVVPEGILDANRSYVFQLDAVAGTSNRSMASLLNAPFKDTIDRATATTTSAVFSP